MTRKLWVLVGVTCLLAGSVVAGVRPFGLDDAMALRLLREPQLSPDGSRIVYAVVETDLKANRERSSLWLVPSAGAPPLRLTFRGENDRRPRWSPDGASIAFLSDRESLDARGGKIEGRSQVWLMALAGGEARQVTNSASAVSECAWSPDGKRLVYVAAPLAPDHEQREARRKQGFDAVVAGDHQMSHLWITEVGTGATKQLTSGDFNATEATWSTKGDLIAFVSRPTPGANEQLLSDLYVVPADGGAPRRIVENEGPDFAPAWSPDGALIAYLSNPRRQSSGGQTTIMVVTPSGGAPRQILKGFDSSPEQVRWTPDGRALVFSAGSHTESHIYVVPAIGGAARVVTSGAAIFGAFDLSRERGRLAYARDDARSPADLWVSAIDGTGPVQLTHLNPQLADLALAETEVFKWKGADDWEIEGILVKPPDFQPGRRYPLIVEAHGGPHGAQTVSFNPMWQYFAAHGFLVLAPNFRGSTGYGQAFVDADRNDWGGKDYVDIMKGVDAAVAAGLADPDRLGIEGWSYGGFMTSWIIGQTTRFKAAVAGAAVTNLQSFYGTTDIQRFIEWEYNGLPWDNAVAIRDHSPVTFASKARTPTLILHGSDDVRVPVEQGQQLYMVLKKSGVTVEFVRFPREGHGLREPNHRRDRIERTLAWLEKWTGNSGSTPQKATRR